MWVCEYFEGLYIFRTTWRLKNCFRCTYKSCMYRFAQFFSLDLQPYARICQIIIFIFLLFSMLHVVYRSIRYHSNYMNHKWFWWNTDRDSKQLPRSDTYKGTPEIQAKYYYCKHFVIVLYRSVARPFPFPVRRRQNSIMDIEGPSSFGTLLTQ